MRPRIWPKDTKRMHRAPRAGLRGSCVVPWDLSPPANISRADGAGRNVPASLRFPPAASPRTLPGAPHQVPAPAPLVRQLISLNMGTKRRGAAEGQWEGGPGAPQAAPSRSSPAPGGWRHPAGWPSFAARRCSSGVQEQAPHGTELRLTPAQPTLEPPMSQASKPHDTHTQGDAQTPAP